MRVSFAAKAAVAAALAAASLTVAAPANASQQAALTEVTCSRDNKDQMAFLKFVGGSRCFKGVGDLDVKPLWNTEADVVLTGNHSGWFSYEPTPGDVKVQPFSKYQTLTGRFHPLRHIHVEG
ncbi:hypothetical protein [Streptomyces sp. 147326]|uniref:hypothetical protein n=1 Tax=Streptomyces sp. 147326 TaxID=3074379 RepID=UPI0038576EE5